MIGGSEPSATSRLSAYLSKLNPVPAFPEYTGPFKVGTIDVEIPVADLPSPAPRPGNASDIPTVLFRVFYPAVAESSEKLISWLPAPQRHYVSAYTKFMGVGHTLAELLSYVATQGFFFQHRGHTDMIAVIDSSPDIFIIPPYPPIKMPHWQLLRPKTSDGRP